jgi:hypothetical protein
MIASFWSLTFNLDLIAFAGLRSVALLSTWVVSQIRPSGNHNIYNSCVRQMWDACSGDDGVPPHLLPPG